MDPESLRMAFEKLEADNRALMAENEDLKRRLEQKAAEDVNRLYLEHADLKMKASVIARSPTQALLLSLL
jgi:regulator of replication initiation timing